MYNTLGIVPKFCPYLYETPYAFIIVILDENAVYLKIHEGEFYIWF